MTVYVPKVGDRVRRPNWSPGEFTTVTAVGKARLLAVHGGCNNRECSYDFSEWELAPEPLPEKPEWLNDMWMNVYPVGASDHYCATSAYAYCATSAFADDRALPGRIGRVCLGTGEWVPCKGKEVLS